MPPSDSIIPHRQDKQAKEAEEPRGEFFSTSVQTQAWIQWVASINLPISSFAEDYFNLVNTGLSWTLFEANIWNGHWTNTIAFEIGYIRTESKLRKPS